MESIHRLFGSVERARLGGLGVGGCTCVYTALPIRRAKRRCKRAPQYTMRFASLWGLILALLLAGCSFTGTRAAVNEYIISQIGLGTSTMAQVKQLLGQPSSQRFSSSGDKAGKVWEYEYSRSDVNPLAFIPPVSLVLLVCCKWHTVETRTLAVEFGPDEVVRDLTTDIDIK